MTATVLGAVTAGLALPHARGQEGPRLLIGLSSYRDDVGYPHIFFYRLGEGRGFSQAGKIASAPDRSDIQARLTPDGRYCAYTYEFVGKESHIGRWEVTTNKGGALNLPEADAVDMTGSLDQAGSRLLFSSLRRPGPPGWNLFVVDVPTGSYRELPGLNSDEDDRMPAWSGDGRWLVYAASRPTGAGLQDLYLYDTLEKRHVTLPGLNSPSRETEPAISGDGRWIAFVSTRPADRNAPAGTGDLNVYLYDRSAAALVLLPGLNGPGSDQSPSVSPDGRFIAFVSERFGNAGARDIYVHDRSTRRLVPTGAVNSDRDDFDPSLAYLPAGPD